MTDLNNLANANAELDKTVDDLSKEGNEDALNKALNDDLEQSGDPAQKDPSPTNKEDPKPKEGDGDDGDKGDDPSKNEDPKDDDKKAEKADKIKNLLSDRNEARKAAADAEIENNANAKRIADLEAENARLKSGDQGDGDDPSTDKNKSIDEIVKEKVEKALSAKEQASAAEKSDIAEVEALKKNSATPNSEEYEVEIKAAMQKHPTISAYAAYRMLQGEGIIPLDNASSNSNANKLNTGDRPKNNLIQDKKVEDMTDAEQEAHLREEQASGRLKL